MWLNKHRTPVLDDIEEARALRDDANTDLITLKRQAPYVARMTARLIARREQNHFGDSIQITFSPRGSHV